MVNLSHNQKIALFLIADDELVGVEWEDAASEVFVMDPDEPVEFDSYRKVCYSNWIFANLAWLLSRNVDGELAAFLEKIDPKGVLRAEAARNIALG